ncbi:MAG: alpha/beta hydrolase [Mycobacteriaceae bacterium]
MPGIGDVRRWQPAELNVAAAQLQVGVRTLLGLHDELEATAAPPDWRGHGAAAADAASNRITEQLRRAIAQVQAVTAAVREAEAEAIAVQEALRETDELAARYCVSVGDDGALCDQAPPTVLTDQHFAADRARMAGELRDRVAAIVRAAHHLDVDLDRALVAAVQDTVDAGTTPAAFSGLARVHPTGPPQPPVGAAPAAVNAYWDSLSGPQRVQVRQEHPGWVGNADGIPAAVRDQANRARLATAITANQADLGASVAARSRLGMGSSTDRLNDLAVSGGFEAALARRRCLQAVQTVAARTGRRLLVLDESGEMPRAAVAVGDVDTADHVAVRVPGMTTAVAESLGRKDSAAAELVGQAWRELALAGRGRETVAAVTWLGYEAPQWSELDDDTDLTDTAATGHTARQAAPALASFLNGIDTSRVADPHLSVTAHSYGSTAAGYALQQGTGVDDAVFYGSPGLGTSTLSDLQVPDGHVFVEEARGDAVADLSAFGADPNQLGGVRVLSVEAGTSPDGVARAGSVGHSQYEVSGSMAQHNQAAVVAGVPERAQPGRAFGVGDVLGWWPGSRR